MQLFISPPNSNQFLLPYHPLSWVLYIGRNSSFLCLFCQVCLLRSGRPAQKLSSGDPWLMSLSQDVPAECPGREGCACRRLGLETEGGETRLAFLGPSHCPCPGTFTVFSVYIRSTPSPGRQALHVVPSVTLKAGSSLSLLVCGKDTSYPCQGWKRGHNDRC